MSSIITGAGLDSFRSQFTAGTTYALAELIDNSIQWKRPDLDCNITIIMLEHGSSSQFKLDELLIVDNGVGMSKETIETCLTFGGGRNHGTEERGKLGKYGLGLPYGSCSQSPNYHVFSWESPKALFHTFRDHSKYEPDESVESEPVDKLEGLPNNFYDFLPELKSYKSGTVIQWKDCDRLDVARSKTLINHVNLNLGRIYRHFIKHGVSIRFLVYRAAGNRYIKDSELSQPIGVFDPMFLMEHTVLPAPFGEEATNLPWGGDNGTGEKDLVFEETVKGGTRAHEIKLRFSIAKAEIQGPKGKQGGGGVEPGKTYYKKAIGISLVRAKRELKLSDFGFPFPNGSWDPRHRWWSVEVQFEPITDDLLGVNANKLDARNFKYLSSEDFQEYESTGMVDESIKLRHLLSKEIDQAIKEMFKVILARTTGIQSRQRCPSCKEKSFADGKCEKCDYTADICPTHGMKLENGKCGICDRTPDIPMCIIHKIPLENEKCPKCPERLGELEQEVKEEFVGILKSAYPEIKDDQGAIERTMNWFVQSNRRYFIIFTDLRSPGVFINPVEFQDQFVIIEVNTRHPFYEFFIQDIIDLDEADRLTPLLLFIASWIEAERKDYSNSEVLERFRSSFGTNLMEVIANWHVE